jgi:predicted alpha/beta superfamily hydrolase
MKKYHLPINIFFFLCLISIVYGQNKNIIIGKSIKIFSKILNEERLLQIHLPENYETDSSRYPVLITLDGERFFNSTAATVQFLATYGHIPSMIVVGIPNTDRIRDFSYEKTEKNSIRGADRFLQFLEKELIPFINKKYRTLSYRIIKGWCATGVFCNHTLFTNPSLFNAYIASSPYLVEDAKCILQLVDEFPNNGLGSNNFLYMSVGGRDRPDAKIEVPKFAERLKKRNFKNLNWHYTYMEIEDHFTIDFKTLQKAFEVLFSDMIYARNIVKDGFEAGREKFRVLARTFGFQEIFPEKTMARMGYVLLNQELFKDAVTLFRIATEYYPDSYRTYENLGEAYMLYGKKDLAIKNFEKSLEIYPENAYAKDMLIKLKNEIK